MVAPVALAGVLGFVFAAALLLAGARGRRLDSNHYCRRCGYEEGVMVGESCPECGRRLLLSSRRIAFDMNHPVLARLFAVTRRGRRQRRWGMLTAGLLLLFVSGAAVGSAAWVELSNVNMQHLKPMRMIFAEAAGEDGAAANAALLELERRYNAGRLTPQQQARWQRLETYQQERRIQRMLAAAPALPRAVPARAPVARPAPTFRGPSPWSRRESAATADAPAFTKPDIELAEDVEQDLEAFYQERAARYRDQLREVVGAEEAVLTKNNEIRVSRVRPPLPPPARPVETTSILDGEGWTSGLDWSGGAWSGGLAATPGPGGLGTGMRSVGLRPALRGGGMRFEVGAPSAASPLDTVRVPGDRATRRVTSRVGAKRAL